MFKRITAILLAVFALCIPFTAFADESTDANDDPTTENIIVIKNLNTGNNLPLKSGDSRVFQTGVAARLMTALVAFECIEDVKAKISVPFCASDKDLRGSGSYIGFVYSEANDAQTLEDFLSAALVSSATDACLSLAVAAMRKQAGETMDYSRNYAAAATASTKERAYLNDFVELMNKRAAEIGCTNTVFTSCTGLQDGKSRTTAEDIALIAAAVCGHGKLYEISDKASYTLSTGSNQIFTKNALKSDQNLKGYRLENVKGMAVGYLYRQNPSGDAPDPYCVVTTAESGGLSYVFVCINTTAMTTFDEEGKRQQSAEISTYKTIHQFLPWALASFKYVTVVSPYSAIATIPVKAGKGRDSVTIIARDVIELLVTKDINPETDIKVEYSDISGLSLTAPVAEGQEVGRVKVYLKGELVGETPLVTNDGIMESSALSAVARVKAVLTSKFMLKIYKWALIIFGAYILIVLGLFIYRVVRKYIEAGKGD